MTSLYLTKGKFMRVTKFFAGMGMGIAMWGIGSAHAADARLLAGQRLSANCSSCHGVGGVTVGNALPPLAGQPKEVLVASMKAFKAGTRPATVMHQLAKGYSDEQIELIAEFLSVQGK